MKVVGFNGSPKANGNTATAMKIVFEELEKQGIETEIINVGKEEIRGCIGCGHCAKSKDDQCVFKNDAVNGWIKKMKEADGILLGSPVYYSGVNGTMKSFLDRAFYVIGSNGNFLRHKVGASLAAVRRTGGMPTINELNNFINYSEMFVPMSNYWNVIHGTTPGEVMQDAEGVQIMRVLGKNMAYLMKLVEHGKETVEAPEKEKKEWTCFIR